MKEIKLVSEKVKMQEYPIFYLVLGKGRSEDDPYYYSEGVLKGVYLSQEKAEEEAGEDDQIYELYQLDCDPITVPALELIKGKKRIEVYSV